MLIGMTFNAFSVMNCWHLKPSVRSPREATLALEPQALA